MSGSPGAGAVAPSTRSPRSTSGSRWRRPASVTQSMAATSAARDWTAASDSRWEPLINRSAKKMPSRASGATSPRSALNPECESSELMAATRPRKPSIDVASSARATSSLR